VDRPGVAETVGKSLIEPPVSPRYRWPPASLNENERVAQMPIPAKGNPVIKRAFVAIPVTVLAFGGLTKKECP
jgi:hypothetical protein